MYTKTVEPIPAPDGNATSKAADKQNNRPSKMSDDEIMEKLSMQSTHTLKIMSHSPTVFLALVKHYSLYLFFPDSQERLWALEILRRNTLAMKRSARGEF